MANIKSEPEEFIFDTSFVHNDTSRSEVPFSITPADDNVKGEVSELYGTFGDLSGSDDIDHPRKKRRVIQVDKVDDGSVVDEIREEESVESKIMKLKKLFKSKGKKQIADMTLESAVLLKRLEPVGLEPYKIDLPRLEINHMVTRVFMSAVYGGSSQSTCPDIAQEKLEQHGMDDFMYLKLDYHPFAPQRPGGCGLFFSTEEEVPGDLGLKRVFTRDLRKSTWQYMGQYDVKTTASLSLKEWLDQSDKVRNTWAKNIHKKNWGNVCARIQARDVVGPRREPTRQDVQHVLNDKSWEQITVEEVRQAFDAGKEVRKLVVHLQQKDFQRFPGEQRIAVWTMKCVGYDRDFQLELFDKFPKWTPPEPKKPKKEPKGRKTKKPKQESKTLSPRPSKGKKRKRADIESDDEMVSEDELLYKIQSRGTRSRPICVD